MAASSLAGARGSTSGATSAHKAGHGGHEGWRRAAFGGSNGSCSGGSGASRCGHACARGSVRVHLNGGARVVLHAHAVGVEEGQPSAAARRGPRVAHAALVVTAKVSPQPLFNGGWGERRRL